MKNSFWNSHCLAAALLLIAIPAWAATIPLQDFETNIPLPQAWGVNMPKENVVVKLSPEHPQDGKQSLQLHYNFTTGGEFQYLGVPLDVNIDQARKIEYWIYGNKSMCSFGVQLTDASGETHQFGKLGAIDFNGWKKIVIDLDAGHETWGGDKNGQIDYPIKAMVLTLAQPNDGGLRRASEGDLFFDSIVVEGGKSAKEILKRGISVTAPPYCSEIQGDTNVAVLAPGLDKVEVKCWKQGDNFGTDTTVATVPLDAEGKGSFVFPADTFPHGPITVRIMGAIGEYKDTCYLQLYNKGGASWNEGLPPAPPQVAGMKLLFEDDFKGPLSMGADSSKTYYEHKPPTGSEDFSFPYTFRNFDSPENPFFQTDSYLRIRADAAKKSAGLISSIHGDGKGVAASVPCYFECRFIGPNAPGTWPAFWLMTDYINNPTKLVDELDIIEAYGGDGAGSPNAGDKYLVTPHVWNYSPEDKEKQEAMLKKEWPYPYLVSMNKLGIPSTWFEAPHTYGCLVTEKETTYYCDNIKIGSHATLPMCKERPLFFMINLAVGGGWPVNLSRYNGMADMYVDWVRVYQGAK